VALEEKLFLIGAVSSMLDFTRNFTSASVRVLTLLRAKLAVRQVGSFLIVRRRRRMWGPRKCSVVPAGC